MFFERADIFLLVMCLICSLFGIYMVRIATIAMEASGWVDSSVKCVIVQVFSLFLGLAAFVILTFIDADLLAEQWKLLCVINILLLVALVIFGQDSGTGNKSWIRFAGIGVQPSEIIKVIYIIISAKQMTWTSIRLFRLSRWQGTLLSYSGSSWLFHRILEVPLSFC